MAGRDGTRVLSMMDKSQVKDEWDEYSDFTDKHKVYMFILMQELYYFKTC